jgi:hypothetical protein
MNENQVVTRPYGIYQVEVEGTKWFFRVEKENRLFVSLRCVSSEDPITIPQDFHVHAEIDDQYVHAPRTVNETFMIPFGTRFQLTYKDVPVLIFNPLESMEVFGAYPERHSFVKFSTRMTKTNADEVDQEYTNGRLYLKN